MQLFELDWQGGAAERYFRRQRPGIDDMPWGSIEPSRYPAPLVDAARRSWTEGAYSEYRTAAGFAQLLGALLEAGAPVDVIGMAGGFVADEMVHTELNCRMAMELGGGAPYLVDLAELTPPAPSGRPLLRATELAVRLCCVFEAFSVPLLAGSMRAAAHPLTRAVLERIVRDEAPHAQLGWQVLSWASERLDARDRRHLTCAALDALRQCLAQPSELRSQARDGVTSEGYSVADVNQLGFMESSNFRQRAELAVWREVVEPLARFEIPLDREVVANIMA